MNRFKAFYLVSLTLGLFFFNKVPTHLFPEYINNKIFITISIPGTSPSVIHSNYGLNLSSELSTNHKVLSVYHSMYSSTVQYEINARSAHDLGELHDHIDDLVSSLPSLPNYAPPVKVESLFKSNIEKLATLHLQDYSGIKRDHHDQRVVLERYIMPLIRSVPGAYLKLDEPLNNQISLTLDHNEMTTKSLNYDDIVAQLRLHDNFNLGRIRIAGIDAKGEYEGKLSPSDYLTSIISNKNGNLIQLKDVSKLSTTRTSKEFYTNYISTPSRSLRIYLNRDYSSLNALNVLQDKLDEINNTKLKPLNYKIEIEPGGIGTISSAIFQMILSIAIGIVLTLIVLLAFKVPLRIIIYSFGVIPFCLSITFIIMYLANISFNIYTLAAIAFTVGAVLDAPILWFYLQGKYKKAILGALLFSTLTSVAAIAPFLLNHSPEYISVKQMASVFAAMLAGSFIYVYALSSFRIQANPITRNKVHQYRTLRGNPVGLLYFIVLASLVTFISFATLSNYIFNPSHIKTGGLVISVDTIFDYSEEKQNSKIESLNSAVEAYMDDYPDNTDFAYQTFSNPYNGAGVKFIVKAPNRLEVIRSKFPIYLKLKGFKVVDQRYLYFKQPQKLLEAFVHIPYQEGELTSDSLFELRQLLSTNDIISSIDFKPGGSSIINKVTIKPNREALTKYKALEADVQKYIRQISTGTFIGTHIQDGLVYHLFLRYYDGLTDDKINDAIPWADQPVPFGSLISKEVKSAFSEELIDNGKPVLQVKLTLSDDVSVSKFITKFENVLKPLIEESEIFSQEPYLSTETISSAEAETGIYKYLAISILAIISLLVVYFDSMKKVLISLMSIILSMGLVFGMILGASSIFGLSINSILIAPIMMVAGIAVNTAIVILGRGPDISYKRISLRTKQRLQPLLITILTTVTGSLPLLLFTSNVTSAYSLAVLILSMGVFVSSIAMLFLTHSFARIFR